MGSMEWLIEVADVPIQDIVDFKIHELFFD